VFLEGPLERAGLAGRADRVDWLQVWDAVEAPFEALIGGTIVLPDGADPQAALTRLAGELGIDLSPAPE
jgi:hypothetical protein